MSPEKKKKRLLDSAPGQLWLAKTRYSCHQVDMGLSDVSNPRNTKRITNRRFTTNSIRDDTHEAPPVELRPTESRCLVGQWPCPWSGSPLSSPHVYQLNHVFISLRNRRHCPPCHVELVAPFFSFPEIYNPGRWPYHLVVLDCPCACPRLNKDFSPIADPGATKVDNPVIMTNGASLANEPMAFLRNATISL